MSFKSKSSVTYRLKCCFCKSPKITGISIAGLDGIEFKCTNCNKTFGYPSKYVMRRTNRKRDINHWLVDEHAKMLTKDVYNKGRRSQFKTPSSELERINHPDFDKLSTTCIMEDDEDNLSFLGPDDVSEGPDDVSEGPDLPQKAYSEECPQPLNSHVYMQ
jgi:hypothetical protein